MNARPVALLTSLSLLAVVGLGTWNGLDRVESKITDRSTELLASAGFSGSVRASGRNLEIRLSQGDPGAARAVLDAARGRDFDPRSITFVTSATTSAGQVTTTESSATIPPDPVPTEPPSTATTAVTTTAAAVTTTATTTAGSPSIPAPDRIAVRAVLQDDGTLTLDGVVFSLIEQAALVVSAEQAVGTERVIDRLVVVEGDTALGDLHMAGLARVVRLFGGGLLDASASVEDGVVTVSGRLAGPDGATDLSRAGTAAVAQGVGFDTSAVREG